MYARLLRVPARATRSPQLRTVHTVQFASRVSSRNLLAIGVVCGAGLLLSSTFFGEEVEQSSVPLNRYIDHTLLKADATPEDIKKLCEEAIEHDFASVCVNSQYAKLAFDTLNSLSSNHRVKVCCVVGFPLGAMSTEMKAAETRYCLEHGASEIDMVIPVGMLKAKYYAYVINDISAVVTACKAKGAICKVILETSLLTEEEKAIASILALRAGADFIKTSTGFGGGGATIEDIALMSSIAQELGGEVKASGGIRDRKAALAMVGAGATRIGASAGVAICAGDKATEENPLGTKMNLKQFVKEHGTKKLEEDYAITVLRSREEPSLYLFKYSQLNSPFHLPVVRECRGTILDESKDWAIVTYPYEKFFNYGETNAAKLDWSNPVKVTEKTDGSLLILYWYKGKWRVSSSGIPDGTGKILLDNPVDKDSKEHYRDEDGDGDEDVEPAPESQESGPVNFTTFREQFWKVFEGRNYQLPDGGDTNKCFMFELACPVNRVIVVYEEENLLLHGVRDITTLQELEPVGFAEKYQWKVVQTFEYTSLDQVIEAAKKLDPIRAEGFVIRDCNFNRVKVKSPRYVQLSLLSYNNRDNLNDLRLLTILQQNEGDEFLTYFPRYTEDYRKLETAYSTLLEQIDQAWTEIKEKAENEAMLVSSVSNSPVPYRPCLWWLKKSGNGTTREFFANQPAKKLLGLLNSIK